MRIYFHKKWFQKCPIESIKTWIKKWYFTLLKSLRNVKFFFFFLLFSMKIKIKWNFLYDFFSLSFVFLMNYWWFFCEINLSILQFMLHFLFEFAWVSAKNIFFSFLFFVCMGLRFKATQIFLCLYAMKLSWRALSIMINL